MKDTTVRARVAQDVKEQAEAVLSKLGLPVSVVINALYCQIILKGRVPFEMPRGADGTRDAAVMARIEGGIKEDAERILSAQGVTISELINALYSEIIKARGVPFPLSLN